MFDVVIADDDPGAVDWVCAQLPDMGLRVEVVDEGRGVEELLRDGRARVFLLDWRLPDLEPFGWMLRRAATLGTPPAAYALVDRDDVQASTMARLAGAAAAFRRHVDGAALRDALALCLADDAAAADPPVVFDPAPSSGTVRGAPRQVAVYDYLNALPENLLRLDAARRTGSRLYVGALREFASESAVCGAHALAARAWRAADEISDGRAPCTGDQSGLIELARRTTIEMARWLLDAQRLRAALDPAARELPSLTGGPYPKEGR